MGGGIGDFAAKTLGDHCAIIEGKHLLLRIVRFSFISAAIKRRSSDDLKVLLLLLLVVAALPYFFFISFYLAALGWVKWMLLPVSLLTTEFKSNQLVSHQFQPFSTPKTTRSNPMNGA